MEEYIVLPISVDGTAYASQVTHVFPHYDDAIEYVIHKQRIIPDAMYTVARLERVYQTPKKS